MLLSPNIAYCPRPKATRKRRPQPVITATIVTIRPKKRENAWNRYLQLVESGPTIPRNYGPKA